MQPNLWNSLETLSIQAALMQEWQKALGADFSAARVFLRPTQRQAESYPCIHPVSCGCRHRVVFESENEVSAVCDCEEAGCEPIFLRPVDLAIHALNGEMLADAIRHAFAFDKLENVGLGDLRSRLVGSWDVRRSPVLFYVPISENGFLSEIERLSSVMLDPFVLLTPTARFCTPMVLRALRRQGNARMALAGVVALTGPGQLELVPSAKPSVEELLGGFGKRITEGTPLERAIARVEQKLNAIAKSRTEAASEAVSEDVARQAMELVKKLDTGSRLKKPSLVTVFHLYCVNEMSATQIAMQCGCSKTAVVERLQILSQKIGMPVARLRRHSAQFERLEEEMSDWRANQNAASIQTSIANAATGIEGSIHSNSVSVTISNLVVSNQVSLTNFPTNFPDIAAISLLGVIASNTARTNGFDTNLEASASAIASNTAAPLAYTNLGIGAYSTNPSDIVGYASNVLAGPVNESMLGYAGTASTAGAAVSVGGSPGSLLTISFDLPGMGSYTIDCNPMDNADIADLASWVRNVVEWLVGLGFVGMVLRDGTEATRTAILTPQGQFPKLLVLGNSIGWPLAAVYIVAIVAAIAAVPFAVVTWFSVGSTGAMWWQEIAVNPFSGTGVGRAVGLSLWLADQFLPMSYIVSSLLYYIAFRFTLNGVVTVAATIVRALMA